MYLRWIVNPGPQTDAVKKVREIVERNKNAKLNVVRMRKQLRELMKEAEALGLLKQDEEDEQQDDAATAAASQGNPKPHDATMS